MKFLPPANVVCEGYVFTGVCHSFCSQGGGMRGFIWGGMHGFILGAYVVLFGGGVRGFIRGALVGGVCGFNQWGGKFLIHFFFTVESSYWN